MRAPGGRPPPLAAAVALILDSDGGAIGTGFAISGGVVLTCADVVVAAGGEPGSSFCLSFSQVNGTPQVQGQVLSEAWNAPHAHDVALIRLAHSPAGVVSLPLGSAAGCRGHRVRSFGFPGQAVPAATTGTPLPVTCWRQGQT